MRKLIFIFLILPYIIFCQNKKVLFIGIDGCRSDALEIANTPNIDQLIENGLYINDALCSINGQSTYSGPGWSSMITGVWNDKHGVTDNSFYGSNFEEFPPFNVLLEESGQDYVSSSFIMWSPIHLQIFNGTMDHNEIHSEYDGGVALAAAEFIGTESLDILFLDFDDVDHTGHGYGFSPNVQQYISTIEQTDEYIGWVIDAMEARPNYSSEDWLIIVTSDHGGIMSGHGDQSLETRTIPIIMSGNSVSDLNLPSQSYIVDLVPTLIRFMGQELNCSWDLDGQVIGLNLSEYPSYNNCPNCPVPLVAERNNQERSITLNWTQNLSEGYNYSIIRNNELLATIDGQLNQFIDYPELIGINSEANFIYEVHLESDQLGIICNAETESTLGTGIILFDEKFDELVLNPAVDEALSSNGGCTNTIPEDILGWTHNSPEAWSIDNSQMPNSGTIEWRGWSFASKEFWIMADDQQRSLFNYSKNIVAVADPDEWDDCENGASFGSFNSKLSTPVIFTNEDQQIELIFDSHFRNEPPQEIFLTVTDSFGNENILLNYSDDSNSDNSGEDRLNEHLTFTISIESNSQIQFNWKMLDAGNNWFWAIDNVLIQVKTPSLGDVNNDNEINVLDVIFIVNIILGSSLPNDIISHISDLNHDSLSNVVDIILLVNYILNL